MLAIGNGGVVLAEHYISSSLAALLVATVPFWIVLLRWMFMGKGRPNSKVTLGLAVGFLGVWLLISGQVAGADSGGSNQIIRRGRYHDLDTRMGSRFALRNAGAGS